MLNFNSGKPEKPDEAIKLWEEENKNEEQHQSRENERKKTRDEAALEFCQNECAHDDERKHKFIYSKSDTGETRLHQAVQHKLIKTVVFLVKEGAKVDTPDNIGNTPLHWAVMSRNLEMVKALSPNSESINKKNHADVTPIESADSRKYREITTFFKQILNNEKEKPSPEIIQQENLTKTEELQKKNPSMIISSEELSNVLEMIQNKDLAGIEKLYENDPNIIASSDHLGQTLLYLAAKYNQDEIAKFLIAKGADVNARNQWQNTPLRIAITEGHLGVVKILCSNKADVNLPDETDNTPLHLAARHEYAEIARVLMNNHADIHAKNQHKQTPLNIVRTETDLFYELRLRELETKAEFKKESIFSSIFSFFSSLINEPNDQEIAAAAKALREVCFGAVKMEPTGIRKTLNFHRRALESAELFDISCALLEGKSQLKTKSESPAKLPTTRSIS